MIETLEVNIGAIPEVVLIVAKILLIVVPIMLSVAYLTLAERKVIGYVQVRIGPNRVGPRGLLQPIADGLKLLLKEIIIPTNTNQKQNKQTPQQTLAPALAALLFCGGWLSPFQGIPMLGPLFAWVPGLGWLLAKMAFFLFLFLWFRATFPRYRYDQI